MSHDADTTKPGLPHLPQPDLRLRQFTPADLDALLDMHADGRIRAFLLEDEDFTDRRTVQRFLIGLGAYYRRHPGLGFWALERQESRHTDESLQEAGLMDLLEEPSVQRLREPRWRLIGWYNVTPVPHDPVNVEAGARLHPSVWGSTVVSVVAEQVIRHALHDLGRPRLGLYCDPANRSALYRAAYLGFSAARETVHSGKPAIEMWIDTQRHESWLTLPHTTRKREAMHLCRSLLAQREDSLEQLA